MYRCYHPVVTTSGYPGVKERIFAPFWPLREGETSTHMPRTAQRFPNFRNGWRCPLSWQTLPVGQPIPADTYPEDQGITVLNLKCKHSWQERAPKFLGLLILLCLFSLAGCRTRPEYREWADDEVACTLSEHLCDDRWPIPSRTVKPHGTSRMADPTPADCGPLPPDDPGVHGAMHCPGGFDGWPHWHSRGDLPTIEFSNWYDHLPKNDQQVVSLTQPRSIELALLHSRDYQDQVEQLYFAALAFTLEKFEFSTRWFARQSTLFATSGTSGGANDSRVLSLNQNVGFNRSFPAGGQLLVDFANSFVWQFAGDNVSSASSGLLLSFLQPLLRGAAREVRLEQLTQAERNLIYAIRDFVRFRRAFYVDISGGNGYLGLLAVAQGIQNAEENLEALERNLREHEQLARNEQVSSIQVDQVFQQYQAGRLSLLAAQQALAARLDGFKLNLGLPPQLEVQLDPEALKPFELNDPRLESLRERNEALRLSMLQSDEVPPLDVVEEGFRALISEREELADLYEEVTEEWKKWNQQITGSERGVKGEEQKLLWERQRKLADRIEQVLKEVGAEFKENEKEIDQALTEMKERRRKELWKQLDGLVANDFRKQVAALFVSQNQIRVHLIQIRPLTFEPDEVLKLAYANRLDLMNQRGRVVDAYRRAEVAADALEGVLNLRAQARLATDPTRNNPVAFEASANTYQVGFDVEGPVTRLAERNSYRTSQIQYQQARRAFMANKDTIAAQIRADLRNVEFSHFSFDIAREQLITAARQVDQAQLNLRSATNADSSVTNDLLNALQRLLDAKNNLIQSWVQYQTSRMNLFRDLDMMDISPTGVWSNEYEDPFQRADTGTPSEDALKDVDGGVAEELGGAPDSLPVPRSAPANGDARGAVQREFQAFEVSRLPETLGEGPRMAPPF
jgi:outer membrane protein TolC